MKITFEFSYDHSLHLLEIVVKIEVKSVLGKISGSEEEEIILSSYLMTR